LVGSVYIVISFIGQLDPEVKFHSIGILYEHFGEIATPLPVEEN
jgi:Rho GDP-dissociation inhibitor